MREKGLSVPCTQSQDIAPTYGLPLVGTLLIFCRYNTL